MQRRAETPLLKVGGIEIDHVRHKVTRAGDEVKLTPKEFELLSFLARHAGKVLTHRQILTAVWGPAHTEDTQYLRVYIGQLRQKVEDNPDDPLGSSRPSPEWAIAPLKPFNETKHRRFLGREGIRPGGDLSLNLPGAGLSPRAAPTRPASSLIAIH